MRRWNFTKGRKNTSQFSLRSTLYLSSPPSWIIQPSRRIYADQTEDKIFFSWLMYVYILIRRTASNLTASSFFIPLPSTSRDGLINPGDFPPCGINPGRDRPTICSRFSSAFFLPLQTFPPSRGKFHSLVSEHGLRSNAISS